jgi:hypothetical protein
MSGIRIYFVNEKRMKRIKKREKNTKSPDLI